MYPKSLCIGILISCLFVACKKEIKTKNLEGTKWKITSVKTSGGVEMWYYPAKLTCELDNVYEFRESGQLQVSDAGEVCSPPQNGTSTWIIENGRLYLGGGPYVQSGQHQVDKFNDDELIVTNTGTQYVTIYRRHY